MGRPKSNGPFTPLAASYYTDDAIIEAKEHAELLFVRCLSFLANGETDGYITDLQMRHVVGVNLRAVEKRIETLLKVGLILRVDGGFEVRSYLKWNRSAEQIGKFRKRDRERKHLKALESAEVDADSARNPDGIHSDSVDQSTTKQSTTKQGTTSSSDSAGADIRPDVLDLMDLLDERLVGNGNKKPNRTKKNLDAARLMLDRDGISYDDVRGAILWATDNEFWRANILSMSKLREKYPQLRAQAQRQQNTSNSKQPAYVGNLDVVRQFEEEERHEQDRGVEAADYRFGN